MDDEFNLISLFTHLSVEEEKKKMDEAQLQRIVNAAVMAALAAQQVHFDGKLKEVVDQFSTSQISAAPVVEEHLPTTINSTIKCEASLDVVKSIPEFFGDKEKGYDNYVSWRQAAHNAYKVYEGYEGSSKHYEAVTILRNKIRGPADATLTSFNTVLNFRAIIARLDFSYADKRPIHLVEQELGTLRQGNLSVQHYYDEIEKLLTLLTNKTTMSYDDPKVVNSLNEKYRADALRVFISGLKRSLSDTLFSARPKNLPSALALAEELEANRERYIFASNFSANKSVDTKDEDRKNRKINSVNSEKLHSHDFRRKNPNYVVVPEPPVERMEVDPTVQGSKRISTVRRPFKRENSAERNSDRRRQRINHLGVESDEEEQLYREVSQTKLEDNDSDSEEETPIHFLEGNPSRRSLSGK